MSAAPKTKAVRQKPPRTRPASTFSHPVAIDAPSRSVFAAFSPDSLYFATVTLALDTHRLRVFDAVSGKLAAEHAVEGARVTSLAWASVTVAAANDGAEDGSPAKKRKKRSIAGTSTLNSGPVAREDVVGLGLSTGALCLFSPTLGRVVRTLSHAASTAPVLAFATQDGATLWTASADGTLRAWHATENAVLASWTDDRLAGCRCLSVRPGTLDDDDAITQVLAGTHDLRLFAASYTAESSALEELCHLAGHASAVLGVCWDMTHTPPKRVVSYAEADRVAHVWDIDDGKSEARLAATFPLDSDVERIALLRTTPDDPHEQALLAVASSGRTSLTPLPRKFLSASGKKTHKVVALEATCSVFVSAVGKKGSVGSKILSATFTPDQAGRIRIVRLVGGAKPMFDNVEYLDASGNFLAEVSVAQVDGALIASAGDDALHENRRYVESRRTAVQSGVAQGQDAAMDTGLVEGHLDVDLAELSLGQRLKAATGAPDASDSDAPRVAPSRPMDDWARRRAEKRSIRGARLPVAATSLARSLIQALHSADAALLETCLAHSAPALVANSVRRLPPQLAVPLLLACTERLARGARGAAGKGGGGGASAQRGTSLLVWVRAVLVAHSAHLMTMPDLVARLAGLHGTLTARMALRERLLSLNGRLDLVLAQLELRSSAAPAAVHPARAPVEGARYVEGESSDDDDEVAAEAGSDDEGSVEVVELGDDEEDGDSEEEAKATGSDDDNDASDDGSESASGDGAAALNGFVDDEAEEWDDESDEEEE